MNKVVEQLQINMLSINFLYFYYLRHLNNNSDSEVCYSSLSRRFQPHHFPIGLGKRSIESIVNGRIISNFR